MDRTELIAELSSALRGEGTAAFNGRIRPGKVKSRLLEVHAPEPTDEGARHLLSQLVEPAGLRLTGLGESMWTLTNGNGHDVFVVDTIDDRFWLLHSTASARDVERLTRGHLVRDPRVDSAWLPKEVLETLPGDRRLLTSSFNSDVLLPSAGQGSAAARRLRVRVEGEFPQAFLDLIRSNEEFATSAPLASVGTHLTEHRLGEAMVVVDYRGRAVSSGTSFEVASGAIWSLLDQYREFLERLEANHRIRVSSHEAGGYAMSGEVATIMFPRPLQDLERFLSGLLSCREPFRLWGVPREAAPGFWEVNATDLHVGQPLRLEVTAGSVRVLLSESTCGNTLARLVVNLQHHMNAQVSLPSPAAAPS